MSKTINRSTALKIFKASLAAADPARAVLHHVRIEKSKTLIVDKKRYALNTFDRIRIFGSGKASARMAQALEKLLGSSFPASKIDGRVNIPDGAKVPTKRVILQESGHPVPDERGVDGARKIADMARECGERDLVLGVISGGASALMPLPGQDMTLERKREVTRQLLACGANIHEINCVRKHISAIKGGRLAQLAYPATVISLILSDVIGDDLDVIGSGPTVPDSKSCADARAVLEKYNLPIPPMTETPKPGDAVFKRVQNVIIGSNNLSVEAAAKAARELKLKPIVLSTTIDGETREIARMHAAIAREMVAHNGHGVCFLSGGETTVTLRGDGRGGRNQEFVLAALLALEEARIPALRKIVVFSGGTDGIDGPTDAAGACADASVLDKARALGLDPLKYLANNDSYSLFDKVGALVKTGPTGTNVADVRILLIP